MANIFARLRSAPKRVMTLVAVAAAVVTVPAALYAWGPERPTFTINNPADYITFNSITDNPNIGDERNFVGIRESGTNGLWQDNQAVQPGKEYVVRMYVHNNAAANLNLVAENVTAKFNLPTNTANSLQVNGFLSASNAQPTEVYDHATFTSSEDFNLAYVPGSAKFYNNANGGGFSMPESLFTETGAKLGYNQMDGKIPGCFQYAGYLTFIVKPQFAPKNDFTMEKLVSKHGENKWVDNYAAKPGEVVDYLVEYKNTGEAQQDNVTIRDTLPAKMSYVNGSTVFGNSQTPSGTKASDNITGDGINVGSYAPGANAWAIFSAKVADTKDLECGPNKLRNVASVTPEGENPKEDDATVTVEKECQPEQPKPIEVCRLEDKKIVTIDEKDFDSSKYSKNLNDCKETPTPKTTEVCRLSDKQIVTINENEFDETKYSKNMADCQEKPAPSTIEVCRIEDKKIVTIDEKDYDTSKYTQDMSRCKETPVTPTTPVTELPQTGMGESIVSVLGLGSIAAAAGYYFHSRRFTR